jgi:hypothetical protein
MLEAESVEKQREILEMDEFEKQVIALSLSV